MIKKLKATAELYLLVFIMFIFIISIGIYGVIEIKNTNLDTQTLYADRIIPLKQLTNIRFSYQAGIILSAEQAHSSLINLKQAANQVKQARDSIKTNWESYKLTFLTPEEKLLVKEVSVLMERSSRTIKKLEAALDQENHTTLNNIIKDELYTTVNPVAIKLNELVNLQVRVSEEVHQVNIDRYHTAIQKFSIIVLLALITGIPLAYYLANNIKNLINNLRESNVKISETEAKCRAFIKYAGDAIFVLNNDLRITDANNSASNLSGYSHEELLQMKISDIMPPEEQVSLLKRIPLVKKEGGSLHERKLQRKNGSLLDTEVNVRMLDGVGYISIFRDISERQKAQLSIKESAEKYRYLFQNNPAYIIIWDLESLEVLEVNDLVIEKYGYSADEWKHMLVTKYRPKEHQENIKEFAKMMLDSDEPIAKKTWTHIKKNGEEMQMEIASHKIIYNNRKAILSLANDVTEQIKAESALRKSEEKFHSLVDHAADAIFMVADDGVIFDVNRSATELVGYTKEELLGTSVLHLYPKEIRSGIPLIWDKLRREKSFTDEQILLRKDGSTVEVEISRKMLPDATGAIAIVRDITERKRMEAELFEQKEQLKLFIEHSPASLAMFDNNMKYIATSRRWIADYGIKEEIIGKTHYEIFPEIPQHWKDIHQRCLNGAIERNDEDGFLRVDGKMEWLKWEIRPWHKASGEIGGIIMFTEVITEHIQATELFKHQFLNSPDIIVIINKELNIDSINRTISNDIPVKEMIGKSAIDVLPEESREIAREAAIRCFQTGQNQEIENTVRMERLVRSRFVPIIINGTIDHIMVIATDITEQKKAEDNLRKSEEKHRALIENINDAIVLVDENFKVVYQSPSVERIVGYTLEDRKDKTAIDFIHPDDAQICFDFYEKARNYPGLTLETQLRSRHKRGYYIWIELSISNLIDNKNVGAYVVTYRNITERKNFEEQQLLISSIVNSSDDAIISRTLDGKITSWNYGAAKILGYKAEEMLGLRITKLIPPELQPEEKYILENIQIGKSVDHYETKRIRKDGSLIDVSLTVSPIRDTMGNIIGASKIMRNITEQKKSEKIIKQSEANHRQLFELSPAPMWVFDEETHKFIQVNKACITNYGYSEAEFSNMLIDNIYLQEEDRDAGDSRIGKNQPDIFFRGTHKHIKKTGEIIEVEISSTPILVNGRKKRLMIAIDVTEKNLYEQKLMKAAIKVQEEERYEIGGELHDNICQILATAMLTLGMIKKDITQESKSYFDQTDKYIRLASQEIRNLSHRLAPAFFNEATLEDAFAQLLSSFNIEEKYKISLNVTDAVKKYPFSPELQLNLYRILQEQLRNILKYAKATAIEVNVVLKNNVLKMKIKDDGVGFDIEGKKNGIGFANMTRRTQLFSGNLIIKSSVGKGCEITVDVPVAEIT